MIWLNTLQPSNWLLLLFFQLLLVVRLVCHPILTIQQMLMFIWRWYHT
jgi:hypothetical protein